MHLVQIHQGRAKTVMFWGDAYRGGKTHRCSCTGEILKSTSSIILLELDPAVRSLTQTKVCNLAF